MIVNISKKSIHQKSVKRVEDMVNRFDRFKALDVLSSKNFVGGSSEGTPPAEARHSLRMKIEEELEQIEKRKADKLAVSKTEHIIKENNPTHESPPNIKLSEESRSFHEKP